MPEKAAVPRLVWAMAVAARHLYPHALPARALCLRWLLGRHGIEADLRIGVAWSREDRLDAHA